MKTVLGKSELGLLFQRGGIKGMYYNQHEHAPHVSFQQIEPDRGRNIVHFIQRTDKAQNSLSEQKKGNELEV